MSIQTLENARSHPARDASIKSINCVQNRDREGWLSLWHADAVVEDPVGISLLDPEGKGHRGIAAITEFYDSVISQGQVRFHIRESFACGKECANVGTITTRGEDGTVSRCELVMVYKVDDEGLVLSLRAFWEFDELVADVF